MLNRIVRKLIQWLPRTRNQLFEAGDTSSSVSIRFQGLTSAWKTFTAHPGGMNSLFLVGAFIALGYAVVHCWKTFKRIHDENDKDNPQTAKTQGCP